MFAESFPFASQFRVAPFLLFSVFSVPLPPPSVFCARFPDIEELTSFSFASLCIYDLFLTPAPLHFLSLICLVPPQSCFVAKDEYPGLIILAEAT